MRILQRAFVMLRSWFRPRVEDAELKQELEFHLEKQIQQNLEGGMSPAEARRAAGALLGSIQSIREASRAGRSGALWRLFIRDLRYGSRLVRRAPGFAAATILIVALGVSSTSAAFSAMYGVLLRPLPYPQPERLVGLWTRLPKVGLPRAFVNAADYRVWRADNHVFEDVALVRPIANFNLLGEGEPERLSGARTSVNLLNVLGVRPAIGRNFTADEEIEGHARVALLSDQLWKTRFHANGAIVGQTINLSGEPYTVIGVMPADFKYPDDTYQIWTPLTLNPAELNRTEPGFNYLAVGRLRSGVDLPQAQREMDTVARRLAVSSPATNRDVGVLVLPLLEDALGPVRPTLYVVFGAAACLLFISALNLANLFAARAASRRHEFAMRRTLGASRNRLALQALAEVLPILAAGGLLGIFGAKAAVSMFVRLVPSGMPRLDAVAIDGPVLAFSLAVLSAIGVVAGLLPTVEAWKSNLVTAEDRGGRHTTPGRTRTRFRTRLVAAQVALALPLLVGATLHARSLAALTNVDPGFQSAGVLSLRLAIPRSKYPTDPEVAAFCGRLETQVAAVPGIASVGMVNRLPMGGVAQTLLFVFEGVPLAQTVKQVDSRSVTPGYFQTMGIPLVEGRGFTERDRETNPIPSLKAEMPAVGIIDDQLATTLWPHGGALGKRFRLPFPDAPWIEIVGVVGHIRDEGLDVDPRPQVYFNNLQRPQDRMALVVKGRGNVSALSGPVLAAVHQVDPEQPVYDVRTMDAVIAGTTARGRLGAVLVTAFASCALVLAGLGLYGVVAYTVARRTREFGIRLSLGANRRDIAWLVLRQSVRIAMTGVAVGLLISLPMARLMSVALFRVQPFDPPALGVATVALTSVVLIAGFLPARRAAGTDPAITLRAE